MICPRCNNDDLRYFFKHENEMICRKCIMFQSGLKEQEIVSFNELDDVDYQLTFQLSDQQKVLSKKLCELVEANKDVLVYAACGCGKTEIILELIKQSLSKGLVVGICIPRRQVVIELSERLANYFSTIKVVKVCEGYTDDLVGDLIVCTTHQLYNFDQYFDILIIDEPDAFPFANNNLLHNFLKRAYRKNVVYLTATPTEAMLKLETLTMFRRYHNHDLLVPEVVCNVNIILYIRLLIFINENDKVMLFVPTIQLANTLSKLMRTPCIHSKTINKEAIIEDFNNNLFKVLITTTIMERGVTFEAVNICVLFADHSVFSKASLIQIAGRVGRSLSAPNGEGIFLCRRKSINVLNSIKELQMMNA